MGTSAATPAAAPSTEMVVVRDDKGNVLQEMPFVQGKLHGEMVVWETGRVRARLRFVDGVQEGESLFFDDKGQVSMRLVYAGGKMNGNSMFYDLEGRISRKACYLDGAMHGIAVDYHPTGKIREIAEYKANVLDGQQLKYTEDGKLSEKLCFRQARLVPCPDEKGKK